MRKIAVLVLVTALALQASPMVSAQVAGPAPGQLAAGQASSVAQGQASISGTVVSPGGQPLANMTAQARNLLNGQVAGSVSTSTAGQFSIIGLNPGNYVVEIVGAGGQIVGTSAFVSVAAGTAVTTATVTAASGALGALSAATGLAALGATAAQSVTVAAAAAGVAGVVVPPAMPDGRGRGRGSPSR